jgi:hypothetical protein
MADATDSKSVARKGVWVQVPPPVLSAATIGSLPMRCKAIPPHHVVGFPQLLRDAGSFLYEHRRQGRLGRRDNAPQAPRR